MFITEVFLENSFNNVPKLRQCYSSIAKKL